MPDVHVLGRAGLGQRCRDEPGRIWKLDVGAYPVTAAYGSSERARKALRHPSLYTTRWNRHDFRNHWILKGHSQHCGKSITGHEGQCGGTKVDDLTDQKACETAGGAWTTATDATKYKKKS